MLIDWIRLSTVLVLLLPPIALFHGEHVRYRAVMRDWSGYWGRTFGLGLHSIDFFRATLGAWLLLEAVSRAPNAEGAMKYAPIIFKAAVLAVSTVLQAAYCKERDTAHAPFAFVMGLVLGFLPPLVAGFALVLAVALALGANAPAGFFPILSLAIAAIGFLFTGRRLQYEVISAAIAVALPWLFTLMFPRHFVCSYRARPHTGTLPPLR